MDCPASLPGWPDLAQMAGPEGREAIGAPSSRSVTRALTHTDGRQCVQSELETGRGTGSLSSAPPRRDRPRDGCSRKREQDGDRPGLSLKFQEATREPEPVGWTRKMITHASGAIYAVGVCRGRCLPLLGHERASPPRRKADDAQKTPATPPRLLNLFSPHGRAATTWRPTTRRPGSWGCSPGGDLFPPTRYLAHHGLATSVLPILLLICA